MQYKIRDPGREDPAVLGDVEKTEPIILYMSKDEKIEFGSVYSVEKSITYKLCADLAIHIACQTIIQILNIHTSISSTTSYVTHQHHRRERRIYGQKQQSTNSHPDTFWFCAQS